MEILFLLPETDWCQNWVRVQGSEVLVWPRLGKRYRCPGC